MWSVLPADADSYEKEKGKCGNMTGQTADQTYVVGMVGTNCYLAVNGQTKETLIIDPGDQGDDLIHVMKEENLRPVAVLLTHGHFDHAGAAAQVAEAYHIPVYAHELERETLEDPAKNLSASMGGFPRKFSADVYVKDEQELDLAGFHQRVLLTPGQHARGMLLLYVPWRMWSFPGILCSADPSEGQISRVGVCPSWCVPYRKNSWDSRIRPWCCRATTRERLLIRSGCTILPVAETKTL